jgi:hypothetical protein
LIDLVRKPRSSTSNAKALACTITKNTFGGCWSEPSKVDLAEPEHPADQVDRLHRPRPKPRAGSSPANVPKPAVQSESDKITIRYKCQLT